MKNAKMLTITLPTKTVTRLRSEARRKNETISGLLRRAFDLYTQHDQEFYTTKELAELLKRDRLAPSLIKDLGRLLQ
jgi:hypothetical protein